MLQLSTIFLLISTKPIRTDNIDITAFVSRLDAKNMNEQNICDCYNVTDNGVKEIECRCYGRKLMEIPENLDENLNKLIITDTDIRTIRRNTVGNYRKTLKDVTFGNLPMLRVIEKGTFGDVPNLRTLYISHAPQLKFLDGLLSGVISKRFYSLRIVQTGLQEIPDLSHLPAENTMHLLDLDSNHIEKLTKNSLKIRAEQVTLNFNRITSVENYAFNGSQIGKLNLRGNRQLNFIDSLAFKGLESLRELDLSETAIEKIPIDGLNELETLRIEDTPTMKTIPSIYDLANLKIARLTHPFHCCAFKYPKKHDPARHAKYEAEQRKLCQLQDDKITRRDKRDSWQWNFGDVEGVKYDPHAEENPADWTPILEHNRGHPNRSADHSHLNPLRGKTIEHQAGKTFEIVEDLGIFHEKPAQIDNDTGTILAFCGNFSQWNTEIKCYPEPNALNPCEDIMGFVWLRIAVWFVVVLAVLGNMAVILVILFGGGGMTVSRFLICNLAFADLCMGLYLLLIASMDLHSMGIYFNFAFDWQYGIGCKMAGFLTVFACHLSIFTLTVVTFERWCAITYAIHLTRRLRLVAALRTMLIGWTYSLGVATLPLFGVSNYSSTSICLPMEINRTIDKAYLITMILTNSLAFCVIAFCYAHIYFSLRHETRKRTSGTGEMTIAKKMALLVFTDFATWAPISFFSITALAGYPLIGVTKSKILLVFFYPINSCANPYLYALMTSQYRTDLYVLLSKCGLCQNKTHIYRGVALSNGVKRNELTANENGRWRNTPNKHINDEFV